MAIIILLSNILISSCQLPEMLPCCTF